MAINEIEMFMADRPKEYATFCNDLLFRRGVVEALLSAKGETGI